MPRTAIDLHVDRSEQSPRLLGRLLPTDGAVAVDLELEWHLNDDRTLVEHAPQQGRMPPDGSQAYPIVQTVLAQPWAKNSAWESAPYVRWVRVTYSDEQRIGRWTRTFTPGIEGSFVGSNPELVSR